MQGITEHAVSGCAGVARADIAIPASATINLGNVSVNASCTDLVATGTFNLGNGSIFNLRDVVGTRGGAIDGAGSLTLSRTLVVEAGGQLNAPGSSMHYDTNCGAGAPVAVAVPALDRSVLIALIAMFMMLGVGCLLVWRRPAITPRGSGK